jgi:hypothetical protein
MNAITILIICASCFIFWISGIYIIIIPLSYIYRSCKQIRIIPNVIEINNISIEETKESIV